MFVKKDDRCGISEIFIKGTMIPSSLCPEKEKEKEKEDDKDGGKNKKDRDRD